jgi:hypothetical protein
VRRLFEDGRSWEKIVHSTACLCRISLRSVPEGYRLAGCCNIVDTEFQNRQCSVCVRVKKR